MNGSAYCTLHLSRLREKEILVAMKICHTITAQTIAKTYEAKCVHWK
jgi:hypothetical protein